MKVFWDPSCARIETRRHCHNFGIEVNAPTCASLKTSDHCKALSGSWATVGDEPDPTEPELHDNDISPDHVSS